MNAELLYVPACPNRDLARQRLAEAASRADVQLVVREQMVPDADTAAELGMRGSPTILIDGRDVAGKIEPSMSCRLYRTAAGMDGAPSVDGLAALGDGTTCNVTADVGPLR